VLFHTESTDHLAPTAGADGVLGALRDHLGEGCLRRQKRLPTQLLALPVPFVTHLDLWVCQFDCGGGTPDLLERSQLFVS